MISPDEFDAFYKGARSRLLLQTYALTGDLPASRSAVRDSFVGAWHHWRKVSRLPDPEAWVRPHAWSQALRRHTGRPWHRDKSLDPESRATLEALGKLPLTQRKALLLTQLTSASMGEIARELGVTLADAERHLQTATAQFSVHRDVPSTSIRSLLDGLRVQAEQATWPRSTIIRRAGAARRRTHTLIGVGATVAAVVLSGSLVTDVGGATPSLPVGPESTGPSATDAPSDAPLEALPEDTMLDEQQVADHAPGRRWRVTSTSDNTEGDGLVLPCQQTRFADPSGAAALVRTFDTSPRKPEPKTSAFQLSEESDSIRAARKTYATTQRWFAGCTDHRVQLMSTKRVGNVGDEASVFGLQSWAGERPKLVVGVARTGAMTTTTLVRTTAEAPTDYRRAAGLLADAVNGSVRPVERRRVRHPPPAGGGHGAGPRGGRAGHAGRGRPASGVRDHPALGRHRAPQGDVEPGGHRLRQHRLQQPPDEQQPDPVLRDPRREAAGPVRAHADRGHPTGRRGARVRGRHPPEDGGVPRPGCWASAPRSPS